MLDEGIYLALADAIFVGKNGYNIRNLVSLTKHFCIIGIQVYILCIFKAYTNFPKLIYQFPVKFQYIYYLHLLKNE